MATDECPFMDGREPSQESTHKAATENPQGTVPAMTPCLPCDIAAMKRGSCSIHSGFTCAACGRYFTDEMFIRIHDDYFHGGARATWLPGWVFVRIDANGIVRGVHP